MNTHKVLLTLVIVAIVIIVFVVIEWLLITYNGKVVPAPDVDRSARSVGSKGQPLTYVVLGDSTAAGQGASEGKGFAAATAEFLSQDHVVTW